MDFADPPKKTWRECLVSRSTIARVAIAVVVVAGVAVLLTVLPESITYYLGVVLAWIYSLGDVVGPLAFILIYAATITLLVPGFILNIAAGFVWHWWGSLFIWLGSLLGATSSFFLGRYFFREWATFCTGRYERMDVLASAIGSNGLKIMLLIRFSPLMPFAVCNYTLAVIPSIIFWQFMVAISVGIWPGIFAFVYMGTILSDFQSILDGSAESSEQYQIFMLVGFCVTVVAMVLISWQAGRAVKQEMARKRLAAAEFGLEPTDGSLAPPDERTTLLPRRDSQSL